MSFLNGEEYRVALQSSTGILKIEGTLISFDYPFLWLKVDGVKTFFSTAGGALMYIEMIDREAEEAAENAKLERRKALYR